MDRLPEMAHGVVLGSERSGKVTQVRSYRDLIVWQRSLDLAKQVYKSTRCFPREEIYGVTSQLRRAAVSVAANIAEGAERQTTGEYRQFLGISKGSLAELETILLVVRELGYADAAVVDNLLNGYKEVGRLLNGLLSSLVTGH